MKISDEQVKKFIEIYHDEFGVELSWEDGEETANHFFRICLILYCPNTYNALTGQNEEDD